MLGVSHIAVIVDLEQKSHYALERAVGIAKMFAAKITIVTCVYQRSVEFSHLIDKLNKDTIEKESCAFYTEQLAQLAESVQLDNNVELKVVWHKHFHRGLLNYINLSDVDLLLKTAHKHSALDKLFTPTDWHLLRETKVPILFVKQGHWPSDSNVIGAINIDSDSAHQTLNQDIIESTVKLAELYGGDPHLLNVFPWPLIDLERLKHLLNRQDHFIQIRDTHTELLQEYVKDQPIKDNWLHVAEGLNPEEIIPDIINTTHSALLVMGTVGRSGLDGLTIGNTAEKILDEIECEVLALK
jgi:universal stress protein E